jgi:hypothetical protein
MSPIGSPIRRGHLSASMRRVARCWPTPVIRCWSRRGNQPAMTRSTRDGVANLFLVTEPLRGWRQVRISDQRTRIDWAHCIKDLVDVHYPAAERLVLVMDQPNTHSPASLY